MIMVFSCYIALQKEEEESLAALKCLAYFLVTKNKKKDKKGEENYTIPYLLREVPVRILSIYSTFI